jgi:hypothetical protein
MPIKGGSPKFKWSSAQGRGFVFGLALDGDGQEYMVAHTHHVRSITTMIALQTLFFTSISCSLWPDAYLQLNERDADFVAVERCRRGGGYSRICRSGLEKVMLSVPSFVVDVCVQALEDSSFACPVWREGDCGDDAG